MEIQLKKRISKILPIHLNRLGQKAKSKNINTLPKRLTNIPYTKHFSLSFFVFIFRHSSYFSFGRLSAGGRI